MITDLEEVYKNFAEGCKKAADEAFADFQAEYLPWIETDQVMNVETRAGELVERFFSDTMRDDDPKPPPLLGYSGREARELIYKRHKEEIIALIDADKDREIENLKAALEATRGYRDYR